MEILYIELGYLIINKGIWDYIECGLVIYVGLLKVNVFVMLCEWLLERIVLSNK